MCVPLACTLYMHVCCPPRLHHSMYSTVLRSLAENTSPLLATGKCPFIVILLITSFFYIPMSHYLMSPCPHSFISPCPILSCPILSYHHVPFSHTPMFPTPSLTPVSDATHSVTQLHLLLENRPPTPAEYLHKMCGSCTADPLPDIEKRVTTFGETFLRCSPHVSACVYVYM